MDNYSKVILVLFIAVVVGISFFFLGRKVERDSNLNMTNNQATVMQNDIDDGYVDLDDIDNNTYVPNGEYNDVTTDLNTNADN